MKALVNGQKICPLKRINGELYVVLDEKYYKIIDNKIYHPFINLAGEADVVIINDEPNCTLFGMGKVSLVAFMFFSYLTLATAMAYVLCQ